MSGPGAPPRPHYQFFHSHQHYQINIFVPPHHQQQQQQRQSNQQQQRQSNQQRQHRNGGRRGDFQHQRYDGQRELELDHTITEGCANLLEQIDSRVLVVLKDGRTLIGILRSVDQCGNLVLHKAVERIHVDKMFGDISRGVFIVRGDNVALVCEFVSTILFLGSGTFGQRNLDSRDQEKEENCGLVEIPGDQILAAQHQKLDEKALREAKRCEAFKNRGLSYNKETIADDL